MTETPNRDSHGRFKADHTNRNFAIGGALIGAAAVVAGALFRNQIVAKLFPGREGHAAPDLSPDAPTPGTNRAPDAFRPDPTAPVAAADREALRPATGTAPTLSEDRGSIASQP